jgi:hypothetical protein
VAVESLFLSLERSGRLDLNRGRHISLYRILRHMQSIRESSILALNSPSAGHYVFLTLIICMRSYQKTSLDLQYLWIVVSIYYIGQV